MKKACFYGLFIAFTILFLGCSNSFKETNVKDFLIQEIKSIVYTDENKANEVLNFSQIDEVDNIISNLNLLIPDEDEFTPCLHDKKLIFLDSVGNTIFQIKFCSEGCCRIYKESGEWIDCELTEHSRMFINRLIRMDD